MGNAGDGDKSVVITYETLFEIQRREKNRDDLQKLDPTFFSDVVKYLQDKKNILSQAQSTLFSSEEKEKTEIQVQNIRKIIKDLYDRRERKIIETAIIKSKTKSSAIAIENMLPEEKHIFNEVVKVLDLAREDVLYSIINAKEPELMQEIRKEKNEEHEIKHEDENAPEKKAEGKDDKKETKMVRFLQAVPRFYGFDSEIYGPFEQEDIACLQKELADVLILKGRAEQISDGK
ncbi:MAG: hypothetical protein NTV63_04595 [Candidatus Woesearchaeota archaeon]|nr:hypothetical protein [Candidatus Woesearchaeota archaeon]